MTLSLSPTELFPPALSATVPVSCGMSDFLSVQRRIHPCDCHCLCLILPHLAGVLAHHQDRSLWKRPRMLHPLLRRLTLLGERKSISPHISRSAVGQQSNLTFAPSQFRYLWRAFHPPTHNLIVFVAPSASPAASVTGEICCQSSVSRS